MQNNTAWLSLASTLLLACNNPAPLDDGVGAVGFTDAAGASAALDRPGRACQLAAHAADLGHEETRGLYGAPAASAAFVGGEPACSGSYAVRVELDVYMPASAEHDPGRGRASLWLRADIERTSNVTLQLCGLDLPARYAYASSAVTDLQLADESFDHEGMPVWKSHLHNQPDGGGLALDAFPILLGIALTDPGAEWPSYDETPAFDCGGGECFPDHDGDGEPGVTLLAGRAEIADAPYPACSEWQARGPSTDNHVWLASAGSAARQLFVGLRTALQLFPQFDATCARASGHARAADIVTRTLDCELADGQRCSPTQATVIDRRSPTFHVLEAGETPPETFRDPRSFVDEALDRGPSGGGQVTLQRLRDDAAHCEAVRAAFTHQGM